MSLSATFKAGSEEIAAKMAAKSTEREICSAFSTELYDSRTSTSLTLPLTDLPSFLNKQQRVGRTTLSAVVNWPSCEPIRSETLFI